MSNFSKHSFTLPTGATSTSVTLPSEQLCHYITDNELERLGTMRQEPVMEIFLGSLGVFFGSLIPAIEGLSRFNAETNPMGIVDLVTVFLTVMAFGIMVVTGILWSKRLKSRASLVESIRSRPRIPVSVANAK